MLGGIRTDAYGNALQAAQHNLLQRAQMMGQFPPQQNAFSQGLGGGLGDLAKFFSNYLLQGQQGGGQQGYSGGYGGYNPSPYGVR